MKNMVDLSIVFCKGLPEGKPKNRFLQLASLLQQLLDLGRSITDPVRLVLRPDLLEWQAFSEGRAFPRGSKWFRQIEAPKIGVPQDLDSDGLMFWSLLMHLWSDLSCFHRVRSLHWLLIFAKIQ